MKLLRDRWGDIDPVKFLVWFIVALAVSALVGTALWNIAFVEGVPRTVEGRVQLLEHRYNKLWRYDWTFIEVQTFSGDTHHYTFLEHIDLNFGVAYRIRFTRRSLFGHHINMYNEVLELERLTS